MKDLDICSQPMLQQIRMKILVAGFDRRETSKKCLKHGTLVIGQLGLAETQQILIGCDHTEGKGIGRLAK